MIKFEDYLEKVTEKINWEIIDLKKNKNGSIVAIVILGVSLCLTAIKAIK